MSDVKTFLSFSCPHFLLQDDEAIAWLIEQIEERKPDVIVHKGDGHEAAAASKFDNEYPFTLKEEYIAHNGFLKDIRKARPGARRVFIKGNHDHNILKWNRLKKDIRDLCDYHEWEPELVEHWEEPTEYVYCRNRGVFRLGQVTFSHGFETGASSDELQSLRLGLPYGLFVSGHTHRPLQVTQAKRTQNLLLPYWYANSGTLRNIVDVNWMESNDRSRWGQAIVVGEAATWRYTESLMPQSPQWEAETVIFRTYNDIVSS